MEAAAYQHLGAATAGHVPYPAIPLPKDPSSQVPAEAPSIPVLAPETGRRA
jgi:hypothetical protein